MPFESGICPRSRASPARLSSVPVETTMTRGRGATVRVPCPTEAAADRAGSQDRGAGLEGLARHAHILTQLRGNADFHRRGRLSDARRMVRVLDLHDGVRALRDRSARHDAPGLPLIEAVVAGVTRRNVARDGQRPRALALQVLAAHRKPVHRGVRKRRQGNQ